MSNVPPVPRSKPVLMLFLGISGVTLLFGLLVMFRETDVPATPLIVYCTPEFQEPVSVLGKSFTARHGMAVKVIAGAASGLLARAERERTGDLLVLASETDVQSAREKHLIAESLTNRASQARVSVLSHSRQKASATKFARHVAEGIPTMPLLGDDRRLPARR